MAAWWNHGFLHLLDLAPPDSAPKETPAHAGAPESITHLAILSCETGDAGFTGARVHARTLGNLRPGWFFARPLLGCSPGGSGSSCFGTRVRYFMRTAARRTERAGCQ